MEGTGFHRLGGDSIHGISGGFILWMERTGCGLYLRVSSFAWLLTMFFSYISFSFPSHVCNVLVLEKGRLARVRGFGVSPLEISTVCGILNGMVTQAGEVLVVCEI